MGYRTIPTTHCICWSGRRDSNSRPPAPHAGTLPGCATPRRVKSISERVRQFASFQRSSSMTFFSSCLSTERLTLRVSCPRGAEADEVAERAGCAQVFVQAVARAADGESLFVKELADS